MVYHIAPQPGKDVIMPSILHIPSLPPPLRLKGNWDMVINWTATTAVIPCQLQLGPAHDPNAPI